MKMQLLHAAPEAEADIGSLDDGLNNSATHLRQPWLPQIASAVQRRDNSIEQILDRSEGSPKNAFNQAP